VLIRKTCKNIYNVKIFCARAIHFSIGHIPFIGIFVLKTASSRMPAISCLSDAWISNQRSISILG
jgi:hypothetical protein